MNETSGRPFSPPAGRPAQGSCVRPLTGAQRLCVRACLAIVVPAAFAACVRDEGRGTGPPVGTAASGPLPGALETDDTRNAAAAVRAALSRDVQLGSLSIEVQAGAGEVVLRGNAPDTATRTRATVLAREVAGVRRVNNELKVQPHRPDLAN